MSSERQDPVRSRPLIDHHRKCAMRIILKTETHTHTIEPYNIYSRHTWSEGIPRGPGRITMRSSGWKTGARSNRRGCEIYEWVGFTHPCQYYCEVGGGGGRVVVQKSRSGSVADWGWIHGGFTFSVDDSGDSGGGGVVVWCRR